MAGRARVFACAVVVGAASAFAGALEPEGVAGPPSEQIAEPEPAQPSASAPPVPAVVGRAKTERPPLFPVGTRPLESPAASAKIAGVAADTGIMSMAAPLAAVVGVALLCAFVLRRAFSVGGNLAGSMGAGGKAPSGILEVLGRYPISRGHSLVLLRLDRRVLLLSHSQGARGAGAAFSTLAELNDPDEVASILLKVQDAEGQSVAKQFQTLMSRARDGEGLPSDGGAGRNRVAAAEGDAVEMWDDAAAVAAPQPARRGLAAMDPVRALRERIAAMKSIAPGEREAAA